MSKTTVPLRFEFLEDTREGKIWKIEALHVTTTKNRRKYTEQELREGARSLSWRPLNINHNEAALLPYPENTTLEARYEPAIKGVVGRMRIADEVINSMIESGRINRLSVEQLPVDGESCDSVACEQHGVTFVGLALLTNDTTPGDGATRIMAEAEGKKQEMMMVTVPFAEITENVKVATESSVTFTNANTISSTSTMTTTTIIEAPATKSVESDDEALKKALLDGLQQQQK